MAGLLLGSQLAGQHRVVLVEQCPEIPTHKYWLTNHQAAVQNPKLTQCVARQYSELRFIAYDDTSACVPGKYCLWDTVHLVRELCRQVEMRGGTILTNHRFYAYRHQGDRMLVRAGRRTLRTRLLVDCMGYESPLAAPRGVVAVSGFYVLHGLTLEAKCPIPPIALHNVILGACPTYLELFPVADDLVHATMIQPARQLGNRSAVARDLAFVIRKSHYGDIVGPAPTHLAQPLFGVVPVGRIRKRALDHIFFFGEAGQVNPAASASGLTRMLLTYVNVAEFLSDCLVHGSLDRRSLSDHRIEYMSPVNRLFQDALFTSLLDFTSDDFRELVVELAAHDATLVNDLIFAQAAFSWPQVWRILRDSLRSRRGLLAASLLRAVARYPLVRARLR